MISILFTYIFVYELSFWETILRKYFWGRFYTGNVYGDVAEELRTKKREIGKMTTPLIHFCDTLL